MDACPSSVVVCSPMEWQDSVIGSRVALARCPQDTLLPCLPTGVRVSAFEG